MQPDITTTPTLTDKDFRAFEACAIPRDLILAAGLRRVDTHEGAAMVGRQSKNGADYAGILIPYLWPGDPHPREYRLRRDRPDLEMKDGQAREKNKYLSPPGKGNLLYFPPDTPPAHLADTSIPIVITEGEKKTLSLAAFYRNRGAAALIVGLSGVWNWRGTVAKTTTPTTGRRQAVKGPIPDLDRIAWRDRQVLIIFDSNVATNDQVFYARRDLTKELIGRGAVVYHVDLPEMEGVNGVDDFLAAAGAAALAKLIDQATAGEPAHRLYYGAEQQDMIPAARRVLEDLATDEADNPTLFWSGGILSRAIPHLDQVKIEPITDELLSYRLAHLGKWYTGPLKEQTDKENRKYRTPPKSLIRHIRATPADATPFPILHRAVTAPVFTAAGDLLTEPGFHRESGIYVLPTFELLPLPARIKPADVNAARALIEDELLIDFPWADPADRENAIALMLLPFVRDMIAGPTPFHMIEAAIPGSGKGLLAHSLLAPALGLLGIASFTQPETDDEWSKRITGALTTGKGAILIDNLRAVLESGVLASALTQTVWNDRIIGTRHLADAPIRCAWVATGNNPTLSSEIARRCVRIRLEPSTDRPEERQDFRHAVLSEWIEAHRAELARACHILIRNWIDQGRPRGSRPMGSFENYAAVMGGILEANGYTRFLSNAAAFRDRADVERSARGALCNEWYEWAQSEPGRSLGAPAGAIFDSVAKRIDGLPLQGYTEAGLIKSLGQYLAANTGIFPQFYDEATKKTRRFRIERVGIRKGMLLWRVDLIEEY